MVSESYSNYSGATDTGRDWSILEDTDEEYADLQNDIPLDDDELALRAQASQATKEATEQAEAHEQSKGQQLHNELEAAMARISDDEERAYQRARRSDAIEDEAKQRGLTLEDYYTSGSPEDRQKVLDCFALKCRRQDGTYNMDAMGNFSRKYRELWKDLGQTAMFDDNDMSIDQALGLYSAAKQASIYDQKMYSAGDSIAETFSGLNSSEYATILANKTDETTNMDILEMTEGLLVSRLDGSKPLSAKNVELLLSLDDARDDNKYPEDLRARIRKEAVAHNYFDVMTKHYDEFESDLLAKAANYDLSQEDRSALFTAVSRFYMSQKTEAEKQAAETGQSVKLPDALNRTLLLAQQGQAQSSLKSYDTPELRASFDSLQKEGVLSDAGAVELARRFYSMDSYEEQGTDWATSQLLANKDYGFIISQGGAISSEALQEAAAGLRTILEKQETDDVDDRVLRDACNVYKSRYYWETNQGSSQDLREALAEARRAVVASGDYDFMTKHVDFFHDDAVGGLLEQVAGFNDETSDEEKRAVRELIERVASDIGYRDRFSSEAEDEIIKALFALGSADKVASSPRTLCRQASVDAVLGEFQKSLDGKSEMPGDDIERIVAKLYRESTMANSNIKDNEARLKLAIIEGGMLGAAGGAGARYFDGAQLEQMLDNFDQRWDTMTPEQRRDQAHGIGEIFDSIKKLPRQDESNKAIIERLAHKISEVGYFGIMTQYPENFTESDLTGLIEMAGSENADERERANNLLAQFYANLDKENTDERYSAETIELARQVVIGKKEYAYMLRNYQYFPEFVEGLNTQSLSKDMLVALSQIEDEDVLSKLKPSQRHAGALLRIVGQGSLMGDLLAEHRDGEETAYYERLFAEGTGVTELIDSLTNSSSGEMRRFAPLIIERAILAERDDPEGLTTVEKYLSDERDFFASDIPHYLKLTKSVIYYDISRGGDFARSGTSVMSGIENYGQAREIVGGDLLRSAMRSNSRSLKSFLERAAKGELEDGQDVYLQQVLDNASRIEGATITSPMELLQRMSSYVAERDRANRAAIVKLDGDPPRYRMAKPFSGSDLKKGIKQRYLDSMFDDGFNAPEMLGADAASDATHYDTDMAISKKVTLDREASGQEVGLDEQLRDSMSEAYGTTKVIMRSDERLQMTRRGEKSAYDPTKYEVFDRSGTEFRGLRSGFGALDIDAFVVIGPDSSDIPRLKFETAKAGCYIPIIDRKTGDVIFTPEDFDRMRARFSGLSQYGNSGYEGGSFETDLDEYHFGDRLEVPASVTDGIGSQSFSELMAGFEDKKQETVAMQNAVVMSFMDLVRNGDFPESFKQHFEMMGSSLNEQYSENAALFSTGSTGRLANVPHDGDYDFMLLLDKQDYDAVSLQLAEAMAGSYSGSMVSKSWETGIRAGKLTVNGEELDLDVSIMQKTDQIATSTDSMLAERYRVMEAQNPEAYRQAIANVIIAKALMKKAGCYKKAGSNGAVAGQGGIGGIGVENWILQSGGSLYDAMKSFVEVSDQAIAASASDRYRAFKLFKVNYPIFDMGQNFQSRRYREQEYPYDDLTEGDRTSAGRFEIGGWEKMLEVCRETISKYEAES